MYACTHVGLKCAQCMEHMCICGGIFVPSLFYEKPVYMQVPSQAMLVIRHKQKGAWDFYFQPRSEKKVLLENSHPIITSSIYGTTVCCPQNFQLNVSTAINSSLKFLSVASRPLSSKQQENVPGSTERCKPQNSRQPHSTTPNMNAGIRTHPNPDCPGSFKCRFGNHCPGSQIPYCHPSLDFHM